MTKQISKLCFYIIKATKRAFQLFIINIIINILRINPFSFHPANVDFVTHHSRCGQIVREGFEDAEGFGKLSINMLKTNY